MQFEEFMVYTFLVLLGISIIVGIINILYNTRIIKRFSGKYVKLLENYELQSEDLSSLFTITFFNNNMSDIKLHSFGIMYCDEQVDFYDEFVRRYHPNLDKKLVIEPADSIKLQVDYERMKKMLMAIRNNKSGLPRIYGFIIDSNGNQTIKRLKDIRKNVKRIFQYELKAEKEARKETIRNAKQLAKENKLKRKEENKRNRNAVRAERREKRKNNRQARREALRRHWHKVRQSVKNFFGRIRKKITKKKESQ